MNGKIENVVIIDIDGLRRDVLYNAVTKDSLLSDDKKKLPTFSKILGPIKLDNIADVNLINSFGNDHSVTFSKNSILVDRCTTVFPSYTHPAQASIFTGMLPKNHGITANFPFDRSGESLGAKRKSQDYSSKDALEFYLEEGSGNYMLKEGTSTIYDLCSENRLKCAVAYNFFISQHRENVDILDFSSKIDGINREKIDWIVPNIKDQIKFVTEGAADGISWYHKNFDNDMWKDVRNYLQIYQDQNIKLPNVLTLYFGGHDHQAHIQGKLDLQLEYLKRTVDPILKELLNIWKQFAINDSCMNTLFVICSDHGHTPVDLDYRNQITPKEIENLVNGRYYDVLDKGELYVAERKCNTVIEITAGLAHIYIRKGVKDPPLGNWKEKPSFNDIKDALRKLCKANKRSDFYPQIHPGAFDYILFKSNEDNAYFLYDYDESSDNDIIKPVTENFGIEKGYVRGRERIEDLLCENSGDILVIVNYGAGFRFEKKSEMKSTHGSLLDSDSYVPLTFSTPFNSDIIKTMKLQNENIAKGVVASAKTIDIIPTILNQFNMRSDEFDGEALF